MVNGALSVVADEGEGCPIVGMGIVKFLGSGWLWIFTPSHRSGERGFELSAGGAQEMELGVLHGFGFGLGLGEVLVELLHEHGGAGVIDFPQGNVDGFDPFAQEGVTDSGDFHAFDFLIFKSGGLGASDFDGFSIAQSRLAGGEGEQVKVLEQLGGLVDFGDRPPFFIAQEEVGILWEVGAEDEVGADVSDVIIRKGGDEVGKGEFSVEKLGGGEGVGIGGAAADGAHF